MRDDVGIASYAEMAGKRRNFSSLPLGGDSPIWSSVETPQAFPSEGKVARLYAATDEVEKVVSFPYLVADARPL